MRNPRSSRAESRAAKTLFFVVILISSCASPFSDVTISPLYAPEPGRRVTFRYTPDCPR